MNNPGSVAVYLNSTVILWSSVMIFCGVLLFLTQTLALWKAKNPRSATLGCFFPLAIILSIALSRAFHWYFNMEQYSASFGAGTFASISTAFTRFDIGSFCMPGVIIGIMLAAGITSLLGFSSTAGRLLDFTAPGLCLLTVFIRLSALFNGSFIGKRPVEIWLLQRLPFCVQVSDAAGNTSYRLAIFFFEAILMFIVFLIIRSFFRKKRTTKMYAPCRSTGNVWRMFLVYYSCVEIIMDSLRTDSHLMHFTFLTSLNAYSAFISFTQVCAVAFLLYVFCYYFICSIASDRFRWKHLVSLVIFLASLAGVGYFGEYSIQRYGYELSGYIIMSISLFAIILNISALRVSCAPEPDYYE